jgi:hypothetical protein
VEGDKIMKFHSIGESFKHGQATLKVRLSVPNRCLKCFFKDTRECPACDSDERSDNNSVYFEEIKDKKDLKTGCEKEVKIKYLCSISKEEDCSCFSSIKDNPVVGSPICKHAYLDESVGYDNWLCKNKRMIKLCEEQETK